MKRRFPWLAATVALLLPGNALADEHEWHLGAGYGYSMLASGEETFHGTGGLFGVRYGLTDAFDLTMDASLVGYPAIDRLAVSTAAGVTYVIDISVWVPFVGAQIGVVDLVPLSCPADQEPCSHLLRPALVIPAGLEYRVLDQLLVGAQFRYELAIVGESLTRLWAGGYVGLALP